MFVFVSTVLSAKHSDIKDVRFFQYQMVLILFIAFNATFSSFSGGRRRSTRREPTDHGQATGKLYHLRLRVDCTLFVIYKAGREPMPYWRWACMSC